MTNNKCFLSIEDQVLLLEERGLIIHSKTEAEDFLRSHNYYRFSGYAREFQEDPRHGKNNFAPGISFDDISSLIDLDQRLRRLLLEALEIKRKLPCSDTRVGRSHKQNALAATAEDMANKDIILNTADSLAIASEGFSSTLHAYSSLRNKCAHYAQL
ncbi:Abi family protein [Arcanobacterium phocae]|uniref:Abi family protein n=1 Tax=Arcanobacterium phocae TaxID=131112 RepID=UPI001C0E9E0B|nr:Abi family protein [Arcanobacterium phocae]